MNNKGFICEKTGTKMIAIREEDLDTLLYDLAETIVMVQSLVGLSQKEEKLRQHHRPYLDVRKEILETGEIYLERLEEMDQVIEKMPYGCNLECFQEHTENEEEFLKLLDEIGEACQSLCEEAKICYENILAEEEISNNEQAKIEDEEESYAEDLDAALEAIERIYGTSESTLLDDLLTMAEYLDVQNHFIKLLGYGLPLAEEATECHDNIMDDVDSMLIRWEQYMHDKTESRK